MNNNTIATAIAIAVVSSRSGSFVAYPESSVSLCVAKGVLGVVRKAVFFGYFGAWYVLPVAFLATLFVSEYASY
jgi:hypothetical protein